MLEIYILKIIIIIVFVVVFSNNKTKSARIITNSTLRSQSATAKTASTDICAICFLNRLIIFEDIVVAAVSYNTFVSFCDT